MKPSTRVIVNTGAQYFRSVVSVLITLYTSRVVLNALGASDYGIFSLIGGVVSMLAFIQTNLANTTQRFLNYYHGKSDNDMVIKVFGNSILTQIVICVVLCGGLFLLTDWVFDHLLNIAPERLEDAEKVYWITIVTLSFNLLSAPFYAALIAHENIIYTSIVQLIEAFLKIPIAISLYYISSGQVVVYTAMLCGVSFLNLSGYVIYCVFKYDECRIFRRINFSWKLAKEMFSFMVWTIYGTFCTVGRTQGIAIILNRAFSTAINAAYGIANQAIGQLCFLSVAITTAINPQIVKAEGAGNRAKVFRLAQISSKYSFLLISIILVPLLVFMKEVLSLWLVTVPPYTEMFCRWVIIVALISWSTQTLNIINIAIGNVKNYNLIVNTSILLTLPLAYFALKSFNAPYTVMAAYAVVSFLTGIIRLLYLYFNVGFSIKDFCKNVLASTIPIFSLNLLICYILSRYLNGLWVVLSGFSSITVTIVGILLIGLKPDEKQILQPWISRVTGLIKKK